MRPSKFLILISLTCLALASTASANGRYPRAWRLIQNPVDSNRLVVAGTFGLAVTRDGGQSWNYVCESAFSDPNTTLDPLVGFTNEGTLYTGTDLDLRRSDPELCEFDVVLGEAESDFVPDYTFDVDGQSLLAVISSLDDDTATVHSSPDGDTWEPLGPPIEGRGVLTLDVAPSDPQRLYISALAPELDDEGQQVGQRGVLLVSSDRGESWQEFEIPGTFDFPPETAMDAWERSYPYIARVHPSDPDVLYVRLSGQRADEFDLAVADDVLLVSYDAGESWVELIRRPSKLLAFELSPDGATVLAGFGVPDDGTVGADEGQHGLYRISHQESADAVEVEHSLQGISTHCLTWTTQGLFACLREFDTGFEVGFTEDPAFTEFETLTPLLFLKRLQPPRACPDDSEAAVCAERWPTDCTRLLSCATGPSTGGATGAAGAEPAAGGEAGEPPQGPMGGMGGTAGAVGGGGEPSVDMSGAGGNSGKSKQSSSCACRFLGASRPSDADGMVALACLLVGLASYQRRRRGIPRTVQNEGDR